ncbi:hypothetical protein [Paenibacillus harenae]|uniref:Uncharacterized protein n=1 Tax=Paenibacillus harenae TaxID=306543 RepID=A0ABT9TXH3_PAEHA|nr:hypothetical protein [Paenibacillus harenae]MDQ0058098.1 hypothetical protein [Paenibacillus harenae]MDQ0111443.1 hypothetical protein [Paenibacillus harenae]
MMSFECECGNTTRFFATGDRDEQGREYVEVEDEDRLAVIFGDDSVLFRCKFCSYTYRLQKF